MSKRVGSALDQPIGRRSDKSVCAKRATLSAADVKRVRTRIGLTQEEFATRFSISLGTLRHWERGDRTPRGTALVLLNIIAKEPKAVLKALAA